MCAAPGGVCSRGIDGPKSPAGAVWHLRHQLCVPLALQLKALDGHTIFLHCAGDLRHDAEGVLASSFVVAAKAYVVCKAP